MTRPFPTSKRRVLKTHGRLLAELAEADSPECAQCAALLDELEAARRVVQSLEAHVRQLRGHIETTGVADAAGKDGT